MKAPSKRRATAKHVSVSPAGVTATGGTWDRDRWPTYFVAGNVGNLLSASAFHSDLLIAVNELKNDHDMATLRGMVAGGMRMFIDSGVFSLANGHATAHNMPMDEALALAPDQIDGFDALLEKYIGLLREIGDDVWGYVEVDQGGRENKIKTRAKLEALGLRPIPVYHPFNDGWDYFDYLAERYDRICFGNLVQADPATRKRLIATAWERRRKYPHLWIHCLGVTCSELTGAFPLNSCDSSTWLSGIRWGYLRAWTANKPLWDTGKGFSYAMDADRLAPDGHERATILQAMDSHMQAITMRQIVNEYRISVGADPGLFEVTK